MAKVSIIREWWVEGMQPDPILTVSEWADRHRVLSRKAASEPGRWRTSRTPYLEEIMDVLSATHPAKKIIFMKGAQIGGTEAGNNWIGYIIDHNPAPTMLVQPTVETAKRNSKLRIDPLIEESPSLSTKVKSSRSRDSGNTVLQKDFPGGTLIMTGANSAVGLRSMPARFLMLDEVDGYPKDLDGEGDPCSLALARSRTFSRRKAFLISTPTIHGESKIETEYENSDKRRYYLPCPFCDEFQVLKFEQLKWENDDPETALYYCEHCGEAIEEHYKTTMLSRGEWRAEEPENEVVGFHINSLYSPVGWYSWKDIVEDFLNAQGDNEKMRTFTNTVLGETWRDKGDAPEWRKLYMRRESYPIGVVPQSAYFLTAGVDIQKNRFEFEVVAWAPNKESWSVDYQIIHADTQKEESWTLLEEAIAKTYPQGGTNLELPIYLTAVDSGYNTQMVYNFCRKFSPNRVIPIKGSETMAMIVGRPTDVDVKYNGKTFRRGMRVWPVGVSIAKSELYSFLKADQPIGSEEIPTGYCHFPEYDQEYFKQITAEEARVKKNNRGYSLTEWVKTRERNEALDCRIYARVAASIVGLDRFREKDWQKMAQKGKLVKTIEKVENKTKPQKKQKRRRRDSSFW